MTTMSQHEAKKFLEERYAEQSQRWPRLTTQVSLRLYLRRNLKGAMRLSREESIA
jgi:hypothetical protein